jgi:tetratricopeptide (TPR) repeat protein
VPGPRAVVIPFGVPSEGRGLGLGLAALVHSFAQIDGHSVALAQLLARREGDPDSDPPAPVEAFVPPQAWRDLAGDSPAPSDVGVVLTGAFEPPVAGPGLIQLLAFDAKDGRTRARAEAHVDGEHAGRTILTAFDDLWSRVGGELGVVRDIGDLSWEALESVLLAERCALHDPARGGPHDRLAAMLHLGRAVGDAPLARFPAGRLAAFALDTAMATPSDGRLADAALRALARASDDAPSQLELLEATAALHLRLGQTGEALGVVTRALEQAPERTRLFALLSEARRARGDLAGAVTAIETGTRLAPDDPVLATEHGVVLAQQGDVSAAMVQWRRVLLEHPLHPSAYVNLASALARAGDAIGAQALVDQALASEAAHPEVLRRAMHLALSSETDGVARAARVARLGRVLLERSPDDAWASLMLGRALAQMGERAEAAARLADVERLAPDSALAAEAQRGRLALVDPRGAQELEAVVRAAFNADAADLGVIAARGRKLATLHGVWPAWYAVGVAERRRERWVDARQAFEATLAASPGCAPAHIELVAVCVSLQDADAAVKHAERAVALEGETPRSLAVLATALLAARRHDAAEAAIVKSLALDDTDEAHRALADRIRAGMTPAAGPLARLRDTLSRWLKRQ